eukprot:g9442.t1
MSVLAGSAFPRETRERLACSIGCAARLAPPATSASPLANRQLPLLARRASPLLAPVHSATELGQRPFSSFDGLNQRVATVLGAQWGDEGKGKLVDILAEGYKIVARFNGGANAGHTLVVDGRKFAFHLLPCGMLHEDKKNLIGNGVVVHVPTLLKELNNLTNAGINWQEPQRLFISNRAHLLFDFHMTIDGLNEEALSKDGDSIGTTRKGIGPCYASKVNRIGVRVGDLLEDWDDFQSKYRKVNETTNPAFFLSLFALVAAVGDATRIV